MKVIAIDGPAGSGKSTVARALADRLGLEYLDTGAMYRAVDLRRPAARHRPRRRRAGRPQLARDVELDGRRRRRCTVDGVDATIEIRGPEVTRAVSHRGRQPRRARRAACAASGSGPTERGGGVVEGRDIGTVVFPDAVLKVYLTARPEVRAERRAAGGHRPRLRDGGRRHRPPRRPRPGPGRQPAARGRRRRRASTPATCTVDEIVDELAGRSPTMADPEPRRRRRGAEAGDAEPRPRRRRAGHRRRPTAEVGGRRRRRRQRPRRGQAKVDACGPAVDVHPPDAARARSYASCAALFLGVAKLCFRLEVRGAENAAGHGPFVLAPVHRSNIDFALVATVAGRACATWARTRSGSRSRSAGSCRCSAPSRCTGAPPTARRCAPASRSSRTASRW